MGISTIRNIPLRTKFIVTNREREKERERRRERKGGRERKTVRKHKK
jgi:hypothetical protein